MHARYEYDVLTYDLLPFVHPPVVQGVTPIHRAICRNRIDIVKLLVAGGCNLKAKTHDRETPLDWAKKFGRKDIVDFLEDIEAHHEHLTDLRKELGINEIIDNFPSSDEESKKVDEMLDSFESA